MQALSGETVVVSVVMARGLVLGLELGPVLVSLVPAFIELADFSGYKATHLAATDSALVNSWVRSISTCQCSPGALAPGPSMQTAVGRAAPVPHAYTA